MVSLPPWAARAPGAPVIVAVQSGSSSVSIDSGSAPTPLLVRLRPGPGSVPVHHYVVTATPAGGSPIEMTVPAASARAQFDAIAGGTEVAVTAIAVNVYGVESDPVDESGVIVQGRDDLPASPVNLRYTGLIGGVRRFTWDADPASTEAQINRISQFVMRSRPGSGWSWADLRPMRVLVGYPPCDTAEPTTSGPHTIGVAATDIYGRLSLVPAVVDVTLDTSAESRVGKLDLSNPANSAWI